ncbi:Hypothetical_protein [Hexamita inflata]|uniref:Hypothetical_protein n=1 Tax=Hexamita inflata TaxID=28002 RepID=A0AA86R0L2_9EUKA|nr:Hypothetical protein HINF_LOCUS54492 [Hexamita inflata]
MHFQVILHKKAQEPLKEFFLTLVTSCYDPTHAYYYTLFQYVFLVTDFAMSTAGTITEHPEVAAVEELATGQNQSVDRTHRYYHRIVHSHMLNQFFFGSNSSNEVNWQFIPPCLKLLHRFTSQLHLPFLQRMSQRQHVFYRIQFVRNQHVPSNQRTTCKLFQKIQLDTSIWRQQINQGNQLARVLQYTLRQLAMGKTWQYNSDRCLLTVFQQYLYSQWLR